MVFLKRREEMNKFFYLLLSIVSLSLSAGNGEELYEIVFGQPETIDCRQSLIFQPFTTSGQTPTITGVLKQKNGRAIVNREVMIYIDGMPYGVARSNQKGLFLYRVRQEVALGNGLHNVYGVDRIENTYIRGQIFTVEDRSVHMTKSGNADPDNSSIWYPYDGAYLNTSTFSLVAGVYDSSNNAVLSETVDLTVDSTKVESGMTTDDTGVVVYALTEEQALADGWHTAFGYCEQSNIYLSTVSFTIDTSVPNPPVITSPSENDTVNSSTVIITGTSDPDNLIISYLNGNIEGNQNSGVTYADDNGNWSIEYDGMISDDYTTYATQTNEANTQSDNSSSIGFTVVAS